MENYILREKYLEKVKPFINQQLLKVFVGQRRVGKSYMIFQLMDFIKANFENSNMIYINLELLEFESIRDYNSLYQYVKEKTVLSDKNYLFVDEIQLVADFEKAINSIFAEGNHDIYFTGSNANLLSGELSTLLRGRYIEIPIYPLSYKEFLIFHKLENSNSSLTNYLKYGGLPYLKNLQLNDEVVFDYLKNIQSAILFKDVVSRFSIRNIDFLNRLVIYLARQTGNIISARKISDYIKSQQISISVNIVLDYLVYLSTAFMIFRVRRTDVTGKRLFEVGEKIYFSDVGIRNSIAGYSPFDLGQIVENVVFLHLKSEDYITYVGKQNEKEIDFIAEKNGEKAYFQVSLRIDEKNTMEREFGNLLSIPDNYPKYVITLDEYTGTSYQGIKHLPLSEFLLNNW
jgi:uncharacterized protein